MLKKLFFVFIPSLTSVLSFAQTLYSERFNNLSLNTGTYTANSVTQTFLYGNLPANMFTINNGDLIADTLSGNYPFYINGNKKKAWLAYKPATSTVNDTFAVSTSWLNPAGAVDSWIITPTILNVDASTVLTWEAMAPDAINSDSYEVYVTTDTSGAPTINDFTGTNRIFSTTGELNSWQMHGISLGAYANQAIRIAFRNNSSDKYQLWLDDIVVQNLPTAYDAETVSSNLYKYSTPNINNYITAIFKNNGHNPINSITINYKVGANATITETQNLASSIDYLASKELTFSVPFISTTAAYYPIKIWASAINGNPDQVASNDTINISLTLSTAIPSKKVLVEEYTGATYGWCPDGYTSLKSIANTNTNVIVASIHDNDNMNTFEGASLISDYAENFPSATIDQYHFSSSNALSINKTDWSTYISQRQPMNVPVSVSMLNYSYTAATRQIDATVSATFVGDVKGDYRLNLYVKENHVYGPTTDNSDNGWNQYSFLYNSPSSPYYQIGSYLNSSTYLLNSSEFQHQYVVDHIAGGSYGNSGIIPVNGNTAGQTYTMSYSYILPNTTGGEYRYNADNIYLIGLVSEYNPDPKKRTILNAAEVKLTSNPEIPVGIKDLREADFQLSVYPNPSSDVCTLSYTISEPQNVIVNIYNTLGELVYIETLNATPGNVNHLLNIQHLPQGNYNIVVSFKHNNISKKLTIIK